MIHLYTPPGHWRHIGYRHGKPLYRWTPGKPIHD